MQPVNYTEQQTIDLLKAYAAGAEVKDLAKVFSKSERSILAKLVSEGVYTPKSVKAAANKRKTKAELIAEIETALDLTEGILETCEKCSLAALEIIHKALVK